MDTAQKLNQLAECKAQIDVLDSEKKKAIDSVLTAEIRQQIADIETEFAPQYNGVQETTARLESEIKADVISNGATIQGSILECTFAKGRISWDTKGLDEAIKVLPQLEQYKKQGEPYATIRMRKK